MGISLSVMNRTMMFLLLIIFGSYFPSKTKERMNGAPCSTVEITTPGHENLIKGTPPFRLKVEQLESGREAKCYMKEKNLKSKFTYLKVMKSIQNLIDKYRKNSSSLTMFRCHMIVFHSSDGRRLNLIRSAAGTVINLRRWFIN